jgi:hypothetical protein
MRMAVGKESFLHTGRNDIGAGRNEHMNDVKGAMAE